MKCEGSRKKARWLTRCNLNHGICAVCGRMFRCNKENEVSDHEV